jgi:hypothetical protein
VKALRHSLPLDQTEAGERAFTSYVGELEARYNGGVPFPQPENKERWKNSKWASEVRPAGWTRIYKTQSLAFPTELRSRFKNAVWALRNQLPLDETEAATQALERYVSFLEQQYSGGQPFETRMKNPKRQLRRFCTGFAVM